MVRVHGLCYWTVIAGLCVGGLMLAWNALAWDPATVLGEIKEKPPTPRYIFTFGDSFTSTGFDVTSNEYPTIFRPLGNPPFPGKTSCGRGPNWVGVLVRDFAPDATMVYNFARSGATINQSIVVSHNPDAPDLTQQVLQFRGELGEKPGHARWKQFNSVAVIWMGTNDVALTFSQALVGLGAPNEAATRPVNERLVNSYIRQLDRLFGAGIRKYIVVNVPPINRNPNFSRGDPEYAQLVQRDIQSFNQKLAKKVSAWDDRHERAEVDILDTEPVFNYILNSPLRYKAQNSTCTDPSGKKCLWTDPFHPGLAIQKVMGRRVYEALQRIGFWEDPAPKSQGEDDEDSKSDDDARA